MMYVICATPQLGKKQIYKISTYRKTSHIRRTESQHLDYYRPVLLNPLKPDVKSKMKM